MLQSWEFNFADFFAHLKAFLLNRTLGFSDSEYPQTVQHFILNSFPHSFNKFLFILIASFLSLGIFLFIFTAKKEMNRDFSQLSRFLRMDKNKIAWQAKLAVLPKLALFWSFFAPTIFIVLLYVEAKFEIHGLGNIIKIASHNEDISLFYGGYICVFLFVLAVNILFLTLRNLLPHK